MKKILGIVLLMIMGISLLAGCSGKNEVKQKNQTQESASEIKSEKPLKIGVIYLTAEHPYYQAHAKHTQNYTAEKGIKLIELDGKIDQANMTSQMENLMAQKVDGIVYCLLEPGTASADINMAQEQGIPVVTFAIKHDPETASAPFVGIPEKEAGALGGEDAAKYFKEKFKDEQPKLCVITQVGIKAVEDRADGFIEGFKKVYPDVEVVSRLNGKGMKDESMKVTEDFIQVNDANVYYGANGDMALGALAALESQGRGTLKTELVVSHDGSEPELLKIADPDSALKFAVANRPKELAQGTIDTLLEIIEGKRDMKNTDNVLVNAALISGDDLESGEIFLQDEYFSDTKLVK